MWFPDLLASVVFRLETRVWMGANIGDGAAIGEGYVSGSDLRFREQLRRRIVEGMCSCLSRRPCA